MTESGGIKGSQGKELADQSINHVPLPSTSRVNQQDLVPELVHSWVKVLLQTSSQLSQAMVPVKYVFIEAPSLAFKP